MRRERAGILTAIWAIVAVAAAALPAIAAATVPPLTHHGRWLTDPQGRVVILHGVQIDRFEPTAPVNFVDISPENVAFIGAQGFNLARVSISYAGVEPEPGRFDDAYVASYLRLDRLLAAAGIHDLVDFQQGQYSAELEGSGFPDWMTVTDGIPNLPQRFPIGYVADPAEERAWDNLWGNARAHDGRHLQDAYAHGLRYLAAQFKSSPAFLGFDVLNEPWPGTVWPTCANPVGCPIADQSLRAFYRRTTSAIRSADATHLVFYEPYLVFNAGAATSLGSIGDRSEVFAFHNYCLGTTPGLPQYDPFGLCGIEERYVLANAQAQSARSGDPALMDEWGNTTDIAQINRMTAEADSSMVGWSYWAYEDCCLSPAAIVADATRPPDAPGNLRRAVLQALVRPYPQAVAGTPLGWSFDPASGHFRLRYRTRPVTGSPFAPGTETQVAVPALRYPAGYSASVSGARVVSAPGSQSLLLIADPRASTVTLDVTPAHPHN